MLWYKLCNSTENDYVDFKQQWYSGASEKVEMIHDILCMSNSLSDSTERYIVIGIAEDKITKEKTIVDVSSDCNCKTPENIIQTLRNYMPVIPKIEVIREQLGDGFIDIIRIIPSARDLPYILKKHCEYEDDKKKKHSIQKDWIYSRDGSRNTGKNEHCSKTVLEELFARKRGEHLTITERFALYLDDIGNWKHPKNYENQEISEDAYYYTKNHKFKMIILDKSNDEDFRKMDDTSDYASLVHSTGLCEDYWKYKIEDDTTYDDYYRWFNVELWADNTLIEVCRVMKVYLKYYFSDKGIIELSTFYLPVPEDMRRIYHLKTKRDILNSLIWKVCNLLYIYDLQPDEPNENQQSLILDFLNYDYIKDSHSYLNNNKDWVHKTIKEYV